MTTRSNQSNLCGPGNTPKPKRLFRLHKGRERRRKNTKVGAYFSTFLILLWAGFLLAGENASLKNERMEFYPGLEVEKKIPSNPGSLCVTEDEFFIIPDNGAGDIKIYEKYGTSLSWLKTIGRSGYAPGELSKPSFSFYDKMEGQLAIMDFGRKKILIYHRLPGNSCDFKLVKEITCRAGAWDMKIFGTRLFISGYTTDSAKNPYDFYYIDITNDQITYLMPSYYKYGLKSFHEYEKDYRSKLDIQAIGIAGWFDINGDDAYFSWKGDLNVLKLNFISGEIKTFGNKPERKYVKPTASKELLKAYREGDINLILKERKKSSYVKDILTTSNHVVVIYGEAGGQGNWMQFYRFDGRFSKEVSIPGQIEDASVWMDKENQILYTLSTESKAGKNQYFILKYEIL